MKHVRSVSIVMFVFGWASVARPADAFTDGACKADMQKFCADVKPGNGAIRDCMTAHEADFSQPCKDNMAEMKQKFEEKKKEFDAACGADLKQFCANVTPGEGREFSCLRAYSDKLSAGCKEKMSKPMGMMQKGMKHQDHNDDSHADTPGDDAAGPPAGK